MARDRNRGVHPRVPELQRQLADGHIDRRSFLRTTTLLGVSAAAAYAMACFDDLKVDAVYRAPDRADPVRPRHVGGAAG